MLRHSNQLRIYERGGRKIQVIYSTTCLHSQGHSHSQIYEQRGEDKSEGRWVRHEVTRSSSLRCEGHSSLRYCHAVWITTCATAAHASLCMSRLIFVGILFHLKERCVCMYRSSLSDVIIWTSSSSSSSWSRMTCHPLGHLSLLLSIS